MKPQLSQIKCVKRRYDFNDGSLVMWEPDDDSGKAHGMFTVSIRLDQKYCRGDIRVARLRKSGPPSEAASLHWLKWEIREAMENK